MNLQRVFLGLMSGILLICGAASAQQREKLPVLEYTEFTLDNGLRVLLHNDKSTPIVTVNVTYYVGSKNEEPGRTGFAHLFEHLMFNGSLNYDDDYFKPLEAVGAEINGYTTNDRTIYYEVLPSNYLELALFMEADRMQNLLPVMTLEKLNIHRDIVKNERRTRLDNRPYGTASEKILANIYPTDHPYHWSVIGSLEDLSSATLDDVKGFFKKYYVPNNASLVIAGDFNEAQAKIWVQKYFGSINPGADIVRPNPPAPKLTGEIRKTYEDAVTLERRYMVWPTVPQLDEDEPALLILSLILSSGRGSRLQSNLVYEKKLAQSVFAQSSGMEIAGTFAITATAEPGQTLDEIEREIDLEIKKIQNNPPTLEETENAKTDPERNFVFGLERVRDKATQMNLNLSFKQPPDNFQQHLDRIRAVTPADVQRVAQKYLGTDRLVMSFVPGKSQGAPKTGAINKPNAPVTDNGKLNSKDIRRDYSANLPKPGPAPEFALSKIHQYKLSNGMNVWLVNQTELPMFSMKLILNSGGTANPIGKEGIARITGQMLQTGTKSKTADEISDLKTSLGAGVFVTSDWDSTVITVETLSKQFDKILNLYADIVVNPVFPDDELQTLRKRELTKLAQSKDSPGTIAYNVFNRLIYGESHPYGRPLNGFEESIESIRRNDVVNFYESIYHPNNSTLVIAGDVAPDTLISKLEKAFANWNSAEVLQVDVHEPDGVKAPGIYVVDKAGAAQSEIRIGQIGVSRDNPDYVALTVMNSLLGGMFSSRVNQNLREKNGYTYGAYTWFDYRRAKGPFMAYAGVQTAVTKEAVLEFLKELNGIRGAIPVTQAELDYVKGGIIRGFPNRVETVSQICDSLSELVPYGIHGEYLSDNLKLVSAIELNDINRVAKKYLAPDKMTIVIVGDKAAITPKLKEIKGLGERIKYLDTNGIPIELDQ